MAKMLEDKVVLITGAGGGIGRAAAVLSAREGARLVVSGLDRDKLAITEAAVKEEGGEVAAVLADISQADDVQAMVDFAVDTYGRLDCAFNNAGVTGGQVGQGGRSTADWDVDAFDRIMNVNAKGTWLCMRAELRQMVKQGGGAILNTSSLAGLAGVITTAGYAASKHAIIGMSKTAALEYAPDVRVNVLCPGFIDTPMLVDTMQRRGDKIIAGIPFGRLGDPMEMAEMACWALSDRARYASGQTFVVDGGCMAGV